MTELGLEVSARPHLRAPPPHPTHVPALWGQRPVTDEEAEAQEEEQSLRSQVDQEEHLVCGLEASRPQLRTPPSVSTSGPGDRAVCAV